VILILAFTRVMARRQRNNTLAERRLTRRFPAGMLRRIAALPVTTEERWPERDACGGC